MTSDLDDILRALDKFHVRMASGSHEWCVCCHENWPCSSSRAAAALREQAKRITQLEVAYDVRDGEAKRLAAELTEADAQARLTAIRVDAARAAEVKR